MRTKSISIKSVLEAIEQQKNDRDFNILKDLKILQSRYTSTSKRDYLLLLRKIIDKYETEEAALVHSALVQKCRAGDVEAIRLYRELQKDGDAGGSEVVIVDNI